MKNFIVTGEARQDLFDIWDYIAEDSLDAADKVIDQLEETFARLGDMPGMGHVREELLDERYRFWSVYSRTSSHIGGT